MEENTMPTFFCNTLNIPKNEYINLLQVGWDKCAPQYTYSHYRDMYIIHFVKSGAGTIETNGRRYTLSKNDAFIIRPDVLTVQSADKEEPWELYFFGFNGKLADELVEKTVFRNNTVSISLKEEDPWKAILDAAIELNADRCSPITSFEYLFKLISFFDAHSKIYISRQNESSVYQKYITTVQEYIQFNYSKPIKVSHIAEQLNVNRSHLYRIFMKHTGSSIEGYLVTVRINAARSLLEDTDIPATTISSYVGYSHPPTFFKIFKKITGLTPNLYRLTMQDKSKVKK